MINCFPDPYPDELIYSVCARFQDRMQYSSHRTALKQLFGKESSMSIFLPNDLNHLITVLPPGHCYTVKKLIDNNTLLPFYQPFLPLERVAALYKDMEGSDGKPIHRRFGATLGCIRSPQKLRFCPLCVQTEREQFGECYWHRLHQVSGVEVCPFHSIFLEDSDVYTQSQKRVSPSNLFSLEKIAQNTSSRSLNPTDHCHNILIKIANDILWLLHQHDLMLGPNSLYKRFLHLLAECELATYSGKVHATDLTVAFRNYYPIQLLDLLQCNFDEQSQHNWLLRLVRFPKSSQHPLRYLLLIHLLGYTVKDFFQLPEETKPFGEGPWPCLNTASEHYNQLQIQNVHLNYASWNGRPISTFSCTCGFTYSRMGPDRLVSDQFRIGRIKCFGPVWESTLRNLWQDLNVSICRIAKELGVDRNTVKKQATRLELSFPRLSPQIVRKEAISSNTKTNQAGVDKKELYQKEWLNALEQNPEAGRKFLRSQSKRAHGWLIKNDREWLEAHMPLPKQAIKPLLIDWNSRDIEFAAMVSNSACHLKNLPGKPVRITIAAIGRDMNSLSLLYNQLSKLPLTAKALADCCETFEEYALRRIQWAIACFQEEGFIPTRTQLMQKAGLWTTGRLANVSQIKESLNTALQTLKS